MQECNHLLAKLPIILGKPQFHIVIPGDPEHVVAGLGCQHGSTKTFPKIVGKIHRALTTGIQA